MSDTNIHPKYKLNMSLCMNFTQDLPLGATADFSDLRLELASEVFSSEVASSSSSLRSPFFFLALRNRPPHPLGRFIACKCRDSCIYGFFDLIALLRASSFALDCLRLSIPWYCFALTKTGSSTASHCNGTTCCCIPINCI